MGMQLRDMGILGNYRVAFPILYQFAEFCVKVGREGWYIFFINAWRFK